MKNKKLLFSSLGMIAVAAMIAGGATYALFTSEVSSDISVKSAKVDIEAELDDLILYSASIEDTDNTGVVIAGSDEIGDFSHDYFYVEQANEFANGGTATLDNGNLALEQVTPGDKAGATLKITNNSNVAIKYRVVMECLSATGGEASFSEIRFFSGLQLDVDDESLTKCTKFASEWTTWTVTDPTEKEVAVAVAVPLKLGNEYQEGNCNMKFTVEAVQANAYTADGEVHNYVEYDDEPVPAAQDVELQANGFDVVVPTSAGGVQADGADVAEGDVLSLKVEKVELSSAAQQAANGMIALSQGATEETMQIDNYEVKVVNQDDKEIISTTQPMTVKVNIGANKAAYLLGVLHTHNGVSTQLVQADSLSGVAGEFYYDAVSGDLTFWVENFSEFTILLRKVPALEVAKVENVVVNYGELEFDMDCAYQYAAKETYAAAKAGEYANWYADYAVKFNKAVNQDNDDLEDVAANGGVVLLGHYDAWTALSPEHEEWTPIIVKADADEEVYLLGDLVTYADVALYGNDDYEELKDVNLERYNAIQALYNDDSYTGYKAPGFTCGALAFEGEALSFEEPLNLTVTLRLRESLDANARAIDVYSVNYQFVNGVAVNA